LAVYFGWVKKNAGSCIPKSLPCDFSLKLAGTSSESFFQRTVSSLNFLMVGESADFWPNEAKEIHKKNSRASGVLMNSNFSAQS